MLTEILRRLDNLIKIGLIHEINYETAHARIKTGNIITDWYPFLTTRAGNTKTWSPPSIGEQCIVFSLGGKMEVGFILPALYLKQDAPSNIADEIVTLYPDGAKTSYNHASGILTISGIKTAIVNASGNTMIECPKVSIKGEVNINGNLKVTGNIQSSGDQIAGNISQQNHLHGNVKGGSDKSGKPQ